MTAATWNKCDAPSLDYQSRMFHLGQWTYQQWEGDTYELTNVDLYHDIATGRVFKLETYDTRCIWHRTDGHKLQAIPG